jgi:fructokinase
MGADEQSTSGQILAIGEILVDFIVADGATTLEAAENFVARSGGAPANASVALARLGLTSAFCGVVGEDQFGARLQAELAAEGVDTSRLRQSNQAATTLAFAWKDPSGDGHFWLLRGADARLNEADADAAGVATLGALVVGSVALSNQPARSAIERAVELARQAGVPVVFDVNLRPTLWSDLVSARPACEQVAQRSTLVKLSLDDAIGLYGSTVTPDAVITTMLALGASGVVLTDGERGCWFSSGSTATFVPAFRVEAIEPTGAGDAFTAAIIARALASAWAPFTVEDVQYAAAAGALATTRSGAWDGLPNRAQLDTFLARQ